MTTVPQIAPGPPALAVVLEALGASAGQWTVDPLASTFEVRGRYVFGPAVTARFAIESGRVEITGDRSGITGTLLVDAASIDSGIALRDQHVRERRRALDVERFPTIRFDLDRAEPGHHATFDISGRVTVRDITQPVQLRVDVRIDVDQAELTVTGRLEHKPFRLDLPGLSRQMTVHARIRAVARSAARRRPDAVTATS